MNYHAPTETTAPPMTRNRWLIVIIALLVGWQLWTHRAPESGVVATSTSASESPPIPGASPGGDEAAATVPRKEAPRKYNVYEIIPEPTATRLAKDDAGLPPEAIATLQLIQAGGPFPYDRDGIVFGNFEGRLPKQKRGYYHEYTVPTPGVSHRGARRIISGGKPPSEFYYTDDHYESFRKIGGAR